MAGFAATVSDWVNKVEGASESILEESALELAEEADQMLVDLVYEAPISPSGYKRTAFLRASFLASTSQMPAINPAARPVEGAKYAFNIGDISAVLVSGEIGRPIYMGYTAAYAGHVHYGANGRPGRPWVDLVAQRWPQIVKQKEDEIRRRLGL